jgi:sulfopyruvate decarboxylase TPP-binding subunit
MGVQIISEGGHIDKFIGDAIMAFFGAFGNAESSPQNAVCAAIRMIFALDGLNSSAKSSAVSRIEIGVGINYGGCILGNIGFQNKMDYTVIGDTVNLASRIESLTKLYNHPVIISEYVYEEVKDNFILRKIDNVRIKRKEKPVGIFAVYSGFTANSPEQKLPGKLINVPAASSLLITVKLSIITTRDYRFSICANGNLPKSISKNLWKPTKMIFYHKFIWNVQEISRVIRLRITGTVLLHLLRNKSVLCLTGGNNDCL